MNFLVLKHADHEGLGLWEECSREEGIALEVMAVHGGVALPPPHQFHAIISLGGSTNLNEEHAHPFLQTEEAFLRRVVEEGIPLLGICFGGRLLARALGGDVLSNGRNEIGWRSVVLDQPGQRDPLFAGLPERFTVFQRQGGSGLLPAGAIRLASSEAGESQAFRLGFGRIAYALQFHLEATPSMVEEWVREHGRQSGKHADTENSRQWPGESRARCGDLTPLSRRLFKNFCHLVRLRFAGVGAAQPPRPAEPVRRRTARSATVEEASERYRELMARGKLRCGITCPLDRIGRCTGGCW